VESENTHLTVKFIGEIDPAKVDGVKAAVARAAAAMQPFEMSVRGAGSFPAGRPRVIWVGVEEKTGVLSRLHEELELALEPLGVESEGREFTAHLTLGRVRSGRNVRDLMKLLSVENPAELGDSQVESLTLFESKLTPQGPIYSPLAKIRLG